MVSSIVPGAAGASALGVDTRYTQRGAQPRADQREAPANGDRVELSSTSIASARDSVRQGIAHVQEALELGREAMSMLLKVQDAARGDAAQADMDAALKSFSERLDAAIARGVNLAAGESIAVHAEPGSAPVVIAGVDMRLKSAPDENDVIAVPAEARADDAAIEQAAQRSLDRLQEAMSGLMESMRALEAHQGFLGAVESASNVRRDLDTDGARLLALQVRQGLEAATGAPAIANVEPQAVLSLFRV
jgi:hypothetical protein